MMGVVLHVSVCVPRGCVFDASWVCVGQFAYMHVLVSPLPFDFLFLFPGPSPYVCVSFLAVSLVSK